MAFRPKARIDVADAYAWYESRRQGLGDLFLHELQRCLRYIGRSPSAFQRVHGAFRQAPLDRFPYVVIYKPSAKEILVMRIFHTSQHPRKKS